MAAIAFSGITKRFPGALALSNVSFDIRSGTCHAVCGENGAGKSTLGKILSGLQKADAGEIRLDGKAITGPHPDIGIVFQEANLLPWRNLDANIRFPFEIKGENPDRAWIAHLLNRVGLDGFGGKFPRELSGGMQQRAAIARALALKPEVLLMDEPFGALDSFTREEMNRLVEEIWLDTKTTIVFITHSIEEAIFLSDRVVVLSARPGRVAKEYRVPFPRPRSLEIMATREVFDLTNRIKMDIVGERARPKPAERPSAEIVRIRP